MPETAQTTRPLDVERVRSEFPALRQEIDGRPLVYLDSAATSHKPQAVLDRLMETCSTLYVRTREDHEVDLCLDAVEAFAGSRTRAEGV